MSMQKFKIILILVTCLVHHSSSQQSCSTINGTVNKVEWPGTNSKTLSKPPCVDQNREFLYRQCLNGTWEPEPLCFYIQQETPPQCPPDFTFAGTFCYTLSQKGHFPPKCPHDNIIPFESYKHIIGEPVWMPVKRNTSNGLGFLTWMEFGPLYKTYYNGNYTYSGGIKNKNCLVYFNSTYILAVSCAQRYPRICAYKTLDQMSSQLCPSGSCRQSDFAPDSPCFCLESKNTKVKAEFVKEYQNNIYGLLTYETCGIGLLKQSSGTYIWKNSSEVIDYTYWSPDVIFDTKHIYGASSTSGWILKEEELPCSVSQSKIQNMEPSLDLTYDSAGSHFVLSVSNPRGLLELDASVWVYCFTDANALDLVYRYDNLSSILLLDNYYLYTMEQSFDGPGTYWCESVRYVDLKTIQTAVNLIDTDNSLIDFVMVLVMEYDERVDPLSTDIVTFVVNIVCPKFNNVEENVFISCRFMKIIDVDETEKKIWINIHLSTYADYQGYDLLLRMSVDEAIGNVKEVPTKLVSFSNSGYCFHEQLNNLTWPQTEIQQSAKSEEFCFTSNREIVERFCDGNFINGAHWSSFNDCETASNSDVTSFLKQIIEKPSEENLAQLCELSKNCSNFNALDVYILGTILIGSMERSDYYEMILEIYNNLFNIEKKILTEAELKMKGTTTLHWLLYFLTKEHSVTDELPSFVEKNNFLISLYLKLNVCGLALQKKKGNFTQTPINCTFTFEDIEAIDNLESAILINTESLENTDILSFIIFFSDAFFTQTVISSKVVSSIVILKLPYDTLNSTNVTIIYKISSDDPHNKACSYWKDGNSQWTNINSTKSNSLLICEDTYDVNKFWALTSQLNPPNPGNKTENDVTDDLITVLGSNNTAVDVVDKLLNISTRYNEFESLDIYLFGQVFKKLSNNKNINLKSLVQIVSNIHKTDQHTLTQSQKERKATDLVLSYIDVIIQNHKYRHHVNAVSENFMIFIYDFKSSNFSGVAILRNKHKYVTQILENGFDTLKYPNLICALFLPTELKYQMGENSKVIVTIFLNDALFPDVKDTPKVANVVFGAIIPKIGAFSAPLIVLHKVGNTSLKSKCAHWYYNQSPDVAGFWKKDKDGTTNGENFIQCDYWHTTHLALLLIDSDRYENKSNALELLTTINFIVSLFCLNSVILTAVFFKKWRSDRSNQVLLNFVCVNILKIIMFYLSNIYKDSAIQICVIIGALLHYFLLSQFCWMLVIAILQFRRLVTVFATHDKILLKVSLCGYLPPLVPVVSVLIFDNQSYVRSKVGMCYPSGLSLYLSIWLPVLVILVINFIIFLKIMYNVIWRKTEPVVTSRKEDRRNYISLSIFLFFMLGLTWTFGFLAELSFGEVFAYLFVLTASLQGYVIFLYFILFNANTRRLYLKAVRSRLYKIN